MKTMYGLGGMRYIYIYWSRLLLAVHNIVMEVYSFVVVIGILFVIDKYATKKRRKKTKKKPKSRGGIH